MAFQSKVKNKVLTGQAREIVSSVLEFMQKEADAEIPIIHLRKVQERTAKATGVGIRTIRRIKREASDINAGLKISFSRPNKHRHKKSILGFDDFDACSLRRMIHDLHNSEKKVPTLQNIYQKMCDECEYQGSIESLRREMHKIGFRWKKLANNRKTLMEKQEIRLLRIDFLKNMRTYRNEQRPIIYVDETYICSSHTHEKSTRLIILNAAGEHGFVPGSYVRWKSNNSTSDQNAKVNYKKWLSDNLLPNIPPKSVVVFDNASFPSKKVDKCPNYSCGKDFMINWLKQKNIPFDTSAIKPELYNIIKLHKPKHKLYEIDELINSKGHDVIRVPPYHTDLNPMKLVWAAMKDYISSQDTKYTLEDVTQYCDDFFTQFTVAHWISRCEHVKRLENAYIENESIVDTVIDERIMNIGEGDSSSESDEEESDGELSESEEIKMEDDS